MKEKYINILKCFISDVKYYGNIFRNFKDNSPILRTKSETAKKNI